MNKKFLLSLLLIVLLTQAASAAFTLTWNEPAANASFNNTPMNRQKIDLNFRVVDDNVLVSDINIMIRYWPTGNSATPTTLISRNDWNALIVGNVDMNCFGTSWATGKDCTYRWLMPLNSALGDNVYLVDVNVISWTHNEYATIYDANKTVQIYINTKMPMIATLKSMLTTLELVVVIFGIFAFIGIWAVAKPEPKSLALIGFGIAMIAAVILLVMGTILTIM